MSKERMIEHRLTVEASHALLMISPPSGIRRPSYNGAPAMPTSARFQTAKAIILRASPARLSTVFTIFFPSVFPSPASQRIRARLPAPLKTLKL
jgi:hypothetical protein